jgi:peptidyl-dipeptidase A
MYEEFDRRLETVASQARWKAVTDVTEEHTGERIGAEKALAAFRGSGYVIDSSRRFLQLRDSLSDMEFRQLDKILLNAAESPGTIPDVFRMWSRRGSRPRRDSALSWTASTFAWNAGGKSVSSRRPPTKSMMPC